MLTSTHKIAGSLTQSAMLHVGHSGRVDAGAVARALRLLRSTSPSSLLLASLDGARRQLALHGEQLLHETLEAIGGRAREARDDPRASRWSTRRWSGAWASRATTRCGSCSTCAAPAAPATRSPTRCAAPTTSTSSCRCRRRSCSSSGSASRRPKLRRLAGDIDEVVKRLARAGRRPRRSCRPPRRCATRWRVPPREAFLGEAEQVRGRRRRRADLLRVDRELPAGRPGAAAGRAHLGRDRRLPARAGGQRRAPARRERPPVPDHQRAPGGAMIDPLERWAQYGEKPDYAGLLTFGGAPTPQDPAELRRLRRRDRRRADGRPRLRPPRRALAPRAIRAASCPPGPHLEVEHRRVRRAADRRLRRRAGDPRRPAALARGDRGDRRPGARRRRAAGRPRRRPLDHRAVDARLRGRPRAGRA